MKAKEALEAEKKYREGVTSVRDLIAPSSMAITNDYLRLGQKFVRTLFVFTYPRYVSLGWFAPVINLNIPLDISMFFYPVPAKVVLKQLKNKVGTVEAEIYDASHFCSTMINEEKRSFGPYHAKLIIEGEENIHRLIHNTLGNPEIWVTELYEAAQKTALQQKNSSQ